MTTLEPRLSHSVWSSASKTWEATWTATWCDTGAVQKEVNLIFSCYTKGEAIKCPTDVAYSITVEECTSRASQ